MKYSYYAVFEFSSEEEISRGIYPIGIYFPDLMGCVSGADGTQHGLEMAKEALELHLEGMLASEGRLPYPSSEENLLKNLAPNEKLFKITVVL